MKHHRILATVIGLSMVAFGLSQITKPKVWGKYIPDFFDTLLPTDKSTAMRIHGSGNTLLGVALILNIKPTLIRYIAGSWWAWVAFFCGRFDWRTATRDMLIAAILLNIAEEGEQ